jgi:hypothetical protein
MHELGAGDLVRIANTDYEMLIIGCEDADPDSLGLNSAWHCAWECDGTLFAEVFVARDLILVRKERRRIPRGGQIVFPCRSTASQQAASTAQV